MDDIDMKDFMTNPEAYSNDDIFGTDIFGLLDAPQEDTEEESVEEPEEKHVVKFKYSESKKKRLLDAFKVTYVNDYGRNDPYHIDEQNTYAAQVRNEIHAIYGNRSIVQYIEAMRKIFKLYRQMYDTSVHRLVIDFPKYIENIVAGDIPAPINHPLLRSNIPEEIVLRYVMNEKSDPTEIKQYISGGMAEVEREMVFDCTNVERDYNTPIEYTVMDEDIQKKVLQSWLAGKVKKKGLDKNYANMVYGLTDIYDKLKINSPEIFKFDEPLSHHKDIISWKNIKRSAPEHIRLKSYTEKDLEDARKGRFIRDVMYISNPYVNDDHISPEFTIPDIIKRMEKHASDNGISINASPLLTKYKLYSQGVIGVKVNKFGRETYIYRDKTKVKRNSVNQLIKEIDKKAEVFKDITRDLNERFRSIQFSKLVDDIQKEQDKIAEYGMSYYVDGE